MLRYFKLYVKPYPSLLSSSHFRSKKVLYLVTNIDSSQATAALTAPAPAAENKSLFPRKQYHLLRHFFDS